jgi:drug/metabolite transporter (DMT)-like permease
MIHAKAAFAAALEEENMNKALSLALLVGGIVLIVFGVNASNSLGSDVSRFFTGSPTDKAIWMLVGGAVLAVVGLVGVARGSK